jgi:site-specific DNA-methyltransferase (adenine-specific)
MMKPYYQDQYVTLFHARLEDFAELPRADAAVVDPPYGSTRLAWDRWPANWPSWMLAAVPQMFVFGTLRVWMNHAHEFQGWKLAQDLVWEKQNGSGLHNDRFRCVHESIIHVYRGLWSSLYHKAQVTHDAQKRTIRRQQKPAHWGQLSKEGDYSVAEGGPRLMRSVLFCKNGHSVGENETAKPEGIIRPLVEYAVRPGGTVLDPMCGSGTVLAVAKSSGRHAIGIEMREDQCEVAARRCTQVMALVV